MATTIKKISVGEALHKDDWAWAQAAWEAGRLTPKIIAAEVGSSLGQLGARAQRGGWVRDPAAKLRLQEELRSQMAEKADVERSRIDRITAQMQAKVLQSHRQDIKQARFLAQSLLAELASISMNLEQFEELGEILRAEDDKGRDRLNDVYQKIIRLPDRTATLTNLVNALKTLIQLERQAYEIEGPLEDPEATRAPAEVTRGLDKIMDKFNEVLALQAPQAPLPSEAVVIDVPAA